MIILEVYFKAEPIDDKGALVLFNLAQEDANITLYYSFKSTSEDENQRDQASYVLTFNTTRINFLEDTFTLNIPEADPINGNERIYLKGGDGSLGSIKLFNGENADDDDTSDNTFEAWRKEFVTLDDDGDFESSKRLVNEANLVFYVDQNLVQGEEPDRLYLYNKTNNSPLIDYFEETVVGSLPAEIAISTHLGILERDETSNDGIRYKMRITSHINNLLLNNTENVELGIAISGNINLEASVPQLNEQSLDDNQNLIPASSIISPRGTILHGNRSDDPDKRLYLEIFYTSSN